MKARPSTAPIALLLTLGLISLMFSLLIPTTTESYSNAGVTPDGQTVGAQTVVTSVDSLSAAIAVGLLVLAVASFAGAGWQVHRRRRWGKAQRTA